MDQNISFSLWFITVDFTLCVVPGNTNPTHVVSTAVPSLTCRGHCSLLTYIETVDLLRNLVFLLENVT